MINIFGILIVVIILIVGIFIYNSSDESGIKKVSSSGSEIKKFGISNKDIKGFSFDDLESVYDISPSGYTREEGKLVRDIFLRLPKENYDIKDILTKKYNLIFEVMFPEAEEVKEMVQTKGINLFYDSIENRRLCCGIRKVKPLRKMLSGLDGWITGIRRDQTSTRENAKMLEIDEKYDGIVKVNPLLDWSWDQVWNYIKKNNVHYHSLIDKG